jgi:hypothetical protein
MAEIGSSNSVKLMLNFSFLFSGSEFDTNNVRALLYKCYTSVINNHFVDLIIIFSNSLRSAVIMKWEPLRLSQRALIASKSLMPCPMGPWEYQKTRHIAAIIRDLKEELCVVSLQNNAKPERHA